MSCDVVWCGEFGSFDLVCCDAARVRQHFLKLLSVATASVRTRDDGIMT